MAIHTGGKPVYGASVGILMLDARFPRIPGDMGNATTWPFPVHYRVVPNATPDRVVRHKAEGTLGQFVDAARDLVAAGADGITTNCGFLSHFQAELQTAVPVPVATSSLMQVAMVQATLAPGRRAGILTISEATLTADLLRAAGVPEDTPVAGTAPDGAFAHTILDGRDTLDDQACLSDNLAAADALLARAPDLGAIVLECTNMVPYAAEIRRHTGLPVYSIYSFVLWFQAGLDPRPLLRPE